MEQLRELEDNEFNDAEFLSMLTGWAVERFTKGLLLISTQNVICVNNVLLKLISPISK